MAAGSVPLVAATTAETRQVSNSQLSDATVAMARLLGLHRALSVDEVIKSADVSVEVLSAGDNHGMVTAGSVLERRAA